MMVQDLVKYNLKIDKTIDEQELFKGVYLTILHATRIPPHIGLIADKKYHSLTIKGQDINTPVNALLKNISIRKIPSLFVKIKAHPIFSNAFLSEHFVTSVQQYNRVDVGVATCLSPVKVFFDEVYNLSVNNVNFLYELLPLLEAEGLIESISSFNIDINKYQLPIYTQKEINDEIEQVRNDYN